MVVFEPYGTSMKKVAGLEKLQNVTLAMDPSKPVLDDLPEVAHPSPPDHN
jgi:hypothetical protein